MSSDSTGDLDDSPELLERAADGDQQALQDCLRAIGIG